MQARHPPPRPGASLPPSSGSAGRLASPHLAPPPPPDSPLLSDRALRWSTSLVRWLAPESSTRTRPANSPASRWWRSFVALWWVAPDPYAPPTPHPGRPAHPETDTGHDDDDDHHHHHHRAGGQAKGVRVAAAQLVLVVLLLLGLVELWRGVAEDRAAATATTRRLNRRVDSAKLRLAGRDPHRVLAELIPPAAAHRFSTRIGGGSSTSSGESAERVWKEDPEAQEVEMYEEASEIGDTTAVVLHWKRTDNVAVIVAHLCQYTFFDSVLVWNNNPEIQLSHKTFAASKCPASKLRIYNSPRNLLFLARFLACAQSDTPYCYFQDDDWLVRPVRALYAQFSRDPEGPIVVHTSTEVSLLFGLEWCFYNNPLHTCFSWVGTGAFTSRRHVDRFLSLSTVLAYPRDELAHADNSFATFQNEPPYVLTSELTPLPTPFGHSSGEDGIRRNKEYIHKGLVRLSAYLGARFPLAELSESEAAAHALTPLLSVSPAPYRPALAPPLPPHPWAHHARSACAASDACVFVTNVQLVPPPDASQYPGPPDRVGSLQRWEEQLGWVARGWTEGTERWREEERWALSWGYANAVDGDPATAFRSPDLIRRGDYLGLVLLVPLDPGVTRTATLHVILEDAKHVLVDHGGAGTGQIRVEVSVDGYRWTRARSDASGTGPDPAFVCAGPRFRSTLPFPSLSNSILVSPHARRILGAERAADQSSTISALARWWTRTRRRRLARPQECTVTVSALAFDGHGGTHGGAGGGWKAIRIVVVGGGGSPDGGDGGGDDRPAFEVGWGVYEMFVTADEDV